MSRAYAALDRLLEVGVLPDAVLRAGSRAGIHLRLRREQAGGAAAQEDRLRALIERMSSGPIAECTAEANQQHYELPAEFFALFLGPRMKYSGCLWPEHGGDLAGAEEAMLALVCERAGIEPGMRVLDLGCGWGSTSLWLAEHVPGLEVMSVSNSHGQRAWIEAECDRRGLTGLEIVTADVNDFAPQWRFDRVVSIEMFEHTHYARTLRAWLDRLDARADEALAILERGAGRREARRLLATWRLFLLSTEEIWGWRDGDEWLVSHYLLERRGGSGTKPLVRDT